jgi:L-seryl-tRNA(Ser) seleniumtransferase
MSSPRIIPSIEQMRQRPEFTALEARHGRHLVVAALREEASALRARLAPAGGSGAPDTPDAVVAALHAAVEVRLARIVSPGLRPVINATGVILHTNLGRAPLAGAAVARVAAIAGGYSNLEYDLAARARGRRDVHAEALLTRLTGAEAAVVVNNNAAATLLVLSALARGREVIVSRGELVEIGGGFRVPDILAQSGAVLREVGTTNRTRVADYAAAIDGRTALILRVHPSNFRIDGFTERPGASDLVALGRRFNVMVVEDLGSGNLLDERLAAPEDEPPASSRVPADPDSEAAPASGARAHTAGAWTEPTVQASVAAGFDAVCFSGDKLLGGPQAGIIVGTGDAIDPVRRHPLMRAFRADKMACAALEATLLEYATGRARDTVPVAVMLSRPAEAIGRRAQALADALRQVAGLRTAIVDGMSAVGGGSAPGVEIATRLLEIEVDGLSAAALEERLRHLPTPVIGRIDRGRVLLDLRTVLPHQDETLADLLRQLRSPDRPPPRSDRPPSRQS